MVKRKKRKHPRQTSVANGDIRKDAKRQAKKPGWRKSKKNKRYYEARANRSDIGKWL